MQENFLCAWLDKGLKTEFVGLDFYKDVKKLTFLATHSVYLNHICLSATTFDMIKEIIEECSAILQI